MTTPTATNCQNGSTLMNTSPYWITAMIEGADHRADDRARAAEQRGPADHHRRDAVEQQRLAGLGGAGGEARGVDHAGERRRRPR